MSCTARLELCIIIKGQDLLCAAQSRDDDVLVRAGTEPASYPRKGTAPASWYLLHCTQDPEEPHSKAWPWSWHRNAQGNEHLATCSLQKQLLFSCFPGHVGSICLSHGLPLPPPYLFPAWLFMDGVCSCVHTVHLFCSLCWFYKNYKVINTHCEIFK